MLKSIDIVLKFNLQNQVLLYNIISNFDITSNDLDPLIFKFSFMKLLFSKLNGFNSKLTR